MIITTAEEARQLDKKAMDIGLTEEVLMENAGRAVIELTKDEIIWKGASVVVVAGTLVIHDSPFTSRYMRAVTTVAVAAACASLRYGST